VVRVESAGQQPHEGATKRVLGLAENGAAETGGAARSSPRSASQHRATASRQLVRQPGAQAVKTSRKGLGKTAEMEHRECLRNEDKSFERRSLPMKKKHTYQSVDVEAVELGALVATVAALCRAPGVVEAAACVVAIDVAKQKFYAALTNLRGVVAQIIRFEHPRQTLVMLDLLMKLRAAKLDVQVVLEPTGTYGDALKHLLHRKEICVYEVSPKRTHDLAEVLDGVPSMHDPKATVVLAQLHAMGKSRQWKPREEWVRKLRTYVDRRMFYSTPMEQHYGRLEAVVARYWPEFDGLVDLRNSRAWMKLLTQYPGPEAVEQSLDSAKRILSAGRTALCEERVERILGAAHQSTGVPMMAEDRQLLGDLVTEIERLTEKVDEIDGDIRKQIASHSVTSLMASVVGPAAAAALVVHAGLPQEYECARAYEKASGLNLKVRSSGKHAGRLKITKRGPPAVRQLLYLAALRLCAQDQVIRAWYQQSNAYKANLKKKAVVGIMRKLIRALWTIAHDPEKLVTFDSCRLFDVTRLDLSTRTATASQESAAMAQHDPSQKSPGKRPPRKKRSPISSAMEASP
jgi:transposase